jgi:hypothetical protein
MIAKIYWIALHPTQRWNHFLYIVFFLVFLTFSGPKISDDVLTELFQSLGKNATMKELSIRNFRSIPLKCCGDFFKSNKTLTSLTLDVPPEYVDDLEDLLESNTSLFHMRIGIFANQLKYQKILLKNFVSGLEKKE